MSPPRKQREQECAAGSVSLPGLVALQERQDLFGSGVGTYRHRANQGFVMQYNIQTNTSLVRLQKDDEWN